VDASLLMRRVEPDDLRPVDLGLRPEGVEHPLRGVVDLVEGGEGRLAQTRALRVVLVLVAGTERRDAGEGRVPHQRECQAQRLGEIVDPAGRGHRQQGLQVLARLLEPVGDALLDQPADPPYGEADDALGQLAGDHRGHPVDQFVRLVHHDHVVLGQDLEVLHGVDGQQRVVGHHHVGLARALPGQLREALGAARAPLGAQALACRHRELPPRLVVHPGDELVSVAGLGVVRPFLDALHHPAGRADLPGVEELVVLVLRHPGGHLVAAQVVAAALQNGELGPVGQQLLERVGEPGQVTVDELPLERDRRGRHDDGLAAVGGVPDRGHQVGQRLAGAGARLDGEVLVGLDRVAHRLRHLHLAGALAATEPGHGRSEQFFDGW
jgi:hypothetical protein